MKTVLSLLLATLLLGCSGKNPLAPSSPNTSSSRLKSSAGYLTWIEKEISRIESLPTSMQPDRVEQCMFENQQVYIFKSEMPGTPDTQIPIYGVHGDTVCLLGGLTCTTVCEGVDFLKARTDFQIIWQKNSKKS